MELQCKVKLVFSEKPSKKLIKRIQDIALTRRIEVLRCATSPRPGDDSDVIGHITKVNFNIAKKTNEAIFVTDSDKWINSDFHDVQLKVSEINGEVVFSYFYWR